MDGYDNGVSSDKCFAAIAAEWNESDPHHWTHVISNAEIVTACLLYGEGDYSKSICLAVGQGFDTDCNGATVGSVVGLLKGINGVPSVWTSRVCDTLESGLKGFERVSINDMAQKTFDMIERK